MLYGSPRPLKDQPAGEAYASGQRDPQQRTKQPLFPPGARNEERTRHQGTQREDAHEERKRFADFEKHNRHPERARTDPRKLALNALQRGINLPVRLIPHRIPLHCLRVRLNLPCNLDRRTASGLEIGPDTRANAGQQRRPERMVPEL